MLYSLLSTANTGVQEYIIQELLWYGYSTDLIEMSAYRIYGYSSTLTFDTPILQTVMVFSVSLRKKKSIIYLLSAGVFFSAVINARAAIVVLLIGIICLITLGKINIMSHIRIIFIGIGIVLIVVIFVIPYFSVHYPMLYKWVIHGFQDVEQFIIGNVGGVEYSYFSYVTSKSKYFTR